jgi:hypothetical protein
MYIHVYNVYTSVYHYHTMYIYSLLSTGRFYNSGTFRGSASCLHVDGIKLHDSFASGGVARLATYMHVVSCSWWFFWYNSQCSRVYTELSGSDNKVAWIPKLCIRLAQSRDWLRNLRIPKLGSAISRLRKFPNWTEHICSIQFRNLRNLGIALRVLRILKLGNLPAQSRNCAAQFE